MPTRRHRGFARTEAESSVRKSSTLGAAATRRRGGLVGVAPGRRQQGPAIRLPDAGSAAQVSLWLSESESESRGLSRLGAIRETNLHRLSVPEPLAPPDRSLQKRPDHNFLQRAPVGNKVLQQRHSGLRLRDSGLGYFRGSLLHLLATLTGFRGPALPEQPRPRASRKLDDSQSNWAGSALAESDSKLVSCSVMPR